MDSRIAIARRARRAPARALALLAGALVLIGAGPLTATGAVAQTVASGSGAQTTLPAGGGVAALEECVTTGAQAERAATFSGEMSAVQGTVRMAIRIDVEERTPGEAEFHTINAPGLGVWRPSDAKVKVYKYLKQVTNLAMPASYRGLVRFRWIGPKGHVVKRVERLTPKCLQPTEESEPVGTTPAPTTGAPSGGSALKA